MNILTMSLKEAKEYVDNNNLYYEKKDETRNFNGVGINVVWWTDTRFKFSNSGMRKVAHYQGDEKQGKLYVY